MRTQKALGVLGVLAALAFPNAAQAAATVHTSSVAFFAALPGSATVARFDALPSGHVIASGSAANGITFGHALGDVHLIVTPGSLSGSGSSFPTTSAPHFLGTSDLDMLLDGDDLALGFAGSNAVGLFIITAEKPGVSLFDGDIRLTAAGAVAALDVDDVQATLADGSRVFFLGVIDGSSTFAAANVGTFGAGGEFAFNVDDVVTALPEPGLVAATGSGLLALAAIRRRRRSTKERS